MSSGIHGFEIELAVELGCPQLAIIYTHIAYWVNFNTRMGSNFKDGKFWTYQTHKQIQAHFPYWSIKQIRTLIDKLVEMGCIIKGNYNKSSTDHTLWYTLVDLKKCLRFAHLGKSAAHLGKSIPDTKPTHTEEQQQQETEQNVGVVSLINSLALSDQEKQALIKRNFSEERLKLAIEFVKTEPIKTNLISTLIWHCKESLPPKPCAISEPVSLVHKMAHEYNAKLLTFGYKELYEKNLKSISEDNVLFGIFYGFNTSISLKNSLEEVRKDIAEGLEWLK